MKEVINTSSWISENKYQIAGKSRTPQFDMVVFCHLRWEFVYQRPQHVISRLAKKQRILFVEEPVHGVTDENTHAIINSVENNVTVYQPVGCSIEEIGKHLSEYLGTHNIATGWFYSAAFTAVLKYMSFDTIVYDCMDELTLFKGANSHLIHMEKDLLSEADVVFTGGKSLYEAKKEIHPNVYCFPSSVDRAHFEQALNGIPVPEDIQMIGRPIIGYCGVIDERINMELIDEVARMNPDASFVMIGPLAKISESDLPRHPNLYYPGMRDYKMLPNYMKGFDIAMMPFALNDATRFISPTKTLEYMAAGKPIISTPIYDVIRDYCDHISIVADAKEFTHAIHDIMELKKIKDPFVSKFNDILDSTSWDTTVEQMELLMNVNANRS